VSVADEARKLVEEIRKELPAGTTLESPRTAARRPEQPEQRDHALVFGAGLTVFVVYVFLNSLAQHADHRAVAADLGDRGLHRRVAVRLQR
jgi:multidrug efflux pump subunit AcrB